MKKTTLSTLVLGLLAIGVVSVAWAGQGALQAPQEPAVEAPAVETPAPEQAPGAELPAGEVELDEATLEALFQEPTETGACCFAECFEQRIACLDSCPPYGDPDRQTCVDQCWSAFNACKSNC